MISKIWKIILIQSLILLFLALIPAYISIKSNLWFSIVSLYFILSTLFLVFKAWYIKYIGIYFSTYICFGSMLFSSLQGYSEGQIWNGMLYGLIGGFLLGGLSGYLLSTIRNKFVDKKIISTN